MDADIVMVLVTHWTGVSKTKCVPSRFFVHPSDPDSSGWGPNRAQACSRSWHDTGLGWSVGELKGIQRDLSYQSMMDVRFGRGNGRVTSVAGQQDRTQR